MKYILTILSFLLISSIGYSQYQVKRSTIGNGSGSASGIANQVSSTLGQSVQGKVTGLSNQNYVGFWYFLPAQPTLTTTAISAITNNSAQSGGNITDDGGETITARGVVWSQTTSPELTVNEEGTTTDGTGTGSFASNITGLSANTTYYVRAYATNLHGTSYGNEESFTTLNTVPILTTADISDIGLNTAVTGGNITSDNGFAVTERGVVYNTSGNPTIADNKEIDGGTGIGSFISNISGLSENQIYYVRAYAINSEGTGYGETLSFTTIPTLGEWGLIALGTLTALLGGWFVYRRFV